MAVILVAVVAISSIRGRETNDYLNKIIEASEESGGMDENIAGNPEAPVLIFEYADYQCEGCAAVNPILNQLLEEYDGKVAVVYRNYVSAYHQNGLMAAKAANAAALQGYWKEYKDFLFARQSDWYYMEAEDLPEQFEKYFGDATEGKGDLAKFREDMASEQVMKKVEFDRRLAEMRGLQWTPLIYVNERRVGMEDMGSDLIDTLRGRIETELRKKGISLD